jgi:uncharacterized protein YqjF (DUF2071 family)
MQRDLLTMTWRDALFAHWPVESELVAERLPDGLDVAIYDGQAWLGIVGFEMTDIRPRGSPIGLSFPELNLRTYVEPDDGGQRGVYFFNLDAADRIGVPVARALFALPYYRAEMRVARERGDADTADDEFGDAVTLTHRRTHRNVSPARFDATYRPTGEVFRPEPGSLEAFLVENYRFYTEGRRLYRGDIRHEPWPLQEATAEIRSNTLFETNGFDRPEGEPLVHYAKRSDVTADRIRRVE